MATERRDRMRVRRNANREYRERVVEVAPTAHQIIVSRVARLLWLIAGVVLLFIALCFVLLVIGANPNTAFVSFIYGVTNLLVLPFAGILPSPRLDHGGVVEVASLFALLIYTLVAWGIVRLFFILFAATRKERRVITYERD